MPQGINFKENKISQGITYTLKQACLEKRWKKSNEQRYLNDDADSPEYRVGGGDGH